MQSFVPAVFPFFKIRLKEMVRSESFCQLGFQGNADKTLVISMHYVGIDNG